MFVIKEKERNDIRERVDADAGEAVLVVGEGDAGQRLDQFLAASDLRISRSYATTLLAAGNVLVNGSEGIAKKYKVKAGDEILVSIPEVSELDVTPENIPIDIVYEDNDLLIVNKARGMVVHPAPGNETGTLVNAILYHCGDTLSSINGVKRPGIVHRIDKDTSGLLVIAKNEKAHESLAGQLKDHKVTREYRALGYDNIKEDHITIDEPIGRDERNRLRRAVYGSNPKDAVTHISVLERLGKHTLVSARLETGRTHQIRVHMAFIKHPLVGDPLYGPLRKASADESGTLLPKGLSKSFIEKYGTGQMLHAKTLGFLHPSKGEYMEFDSEIPEYMRTMIDKVR